jgi:hypothetical protein
MPASAEHPPAHSVDDDDLATELTQRPADALEIAAFDTRRAQRR